MNYSRRDFSKMALGALAAGIALPRNATSQAAVASSSANIVNGVRLGVISYSFRAMERKPGEDYIAKIADASAEVGGGDIELMARLTVQPPDGSREEMRQWRLTTPMSYFSDIRDKFASRGMRIISYTHTFSEDMTDAELDKMMQATRAMGAGMMTLTMCKIAAAARLAPLAEQNGLLVAFHNRPESDRGEVSTPESFDQMLQVSDRFRINLDIGHFTAGNHDAMAALEKFHERISHVHLKDRKFGYNGGANLPWGEGETPIIPVLHTIRDRKWPLSCLIEYEYPGAGTPIEEVKKCMAYARRALAT
jgi:sugar phosphate isomerase/epimerase